MVQQVFLSWSNWNWSKECTPFGPTDNHMDQSKAQWSKEYTDPQMIIGIWKAFSVNSLHVP